MQSNMIRIPKPRRRKVCELQPNPATVVEFPDKLGITAPQFDPADAWHQQIWRILWEAKALRKAKYVPEGHPLRAWANAEFKKSFPPVQP